jgi:hypothetical protein
MPTESKPLAVHEAPQDPDAPEAPAIDAPKEGTANAPEVPQKTATKEQKPVPLKPKTAGAPLPVGAIVLAIVAMVTLSVLAIAVYLQSS